MNNVSSYRVLVLGDFHFGESYADAGARILAEHGYAHSTVHLHPFLQACDATIVNLETPLVRPEVHPSSLAGRKGIVHWGDPEATGSALRALGVDAVSLANNHTLDHGADGLESTFRTLREFGIDWFGAGRTLTEARAPYRIQLPNRLGSGEISFHGSFQYSTRHDEDFAFYADDDSPGCAPLSVRNVPDARAHTLRSDEFHIAFPHWGANYVWRGGGQYQLAHRLLRKQYDLVLGHGGHAMQEVHRKQRRWVVYGLGDGNFQARGKYVQFEEENGILPFSFWAILEIHRDGNRRTMNLKLYPVYSNNLVTNFQPGPVAEVDFDRVVQTLTTRPARPWRFNNPAQGVGQDDLGYFVSLDLGEWPQGERPSRLPAIIETGDPGDWPVRSPDQVVEDAIINLNRSSFSGSMLAVHANRNGASTHWLNNRIVAIESGSKRFLAENYRTHESSLGAAICSDKVRAADFMSAAGVRTPQTTLVNSAAEAVKTAREMSGPVAIKPRSGNKSRGVSTGLVGDEEVEEAFAVAREHGEDVLVQEHIEAAEELRVMASPNQAVAVIRRILPHVVGDGRSSIGQLIEDKNLQRELNPSLRNRPIPVDGLTHRQLYRQRLSLESIPSLGQQVTVRNVGGLSVGADAHQALEVTDDRTKEAAKAAVAAIPGLGWGGVDMIIQKDTEEAYVIEINTGAAYGAALFPAYGEPLDVASVVWKLRLEATAPEVDAIPEQLDRVDFARALPVDEGEGSTGETGTVAFSQLFEGSLKRQGYQIDRRSDVLWQVGSPHGGSIWVTNQGKTAADRAVVSSVMGRHQWVRSLLAIAEVPRTRYRQVRSTSQLDRFVRSRVRNVVLAPANAAWDAPETRVLTADEALDLTVLPGRMWVQARATGRRLRVFASRDRSWAMTSSPGSSRLGRASINAAGHLAVRAVRAVPELRWAVADVLVRPRRIREGQPNGALLEGLTLTPEFSTSDQVIAGDFDAFTRWIVSPPDNQTNATYTPGNDREEQSMISPHDATRVHTESDG